jgi:hypothetical protein
VDEVANHRLGDVEVGDDAVLHRADGHDATRRATEHLLGFTTDGEHPPDTAGVLLDGDDRRLTGLTMPLPRA